MIYYIDHLEKINDVLINQLMPYVSAERREKAKKYRFRTDQVQSVLAFILLRIGLHAEYGVCEMPEIAVNDTNKPYLTNLQEVYFNLSHCTAGVACGISDSELGVDIQNYVDYKDSIATYFMSPTENLAAKAGNPSVEFTRLWTLKESYGKYKGLGICYDMPQISITENIMQNGCICQSHILDNFVLSVASTKHIDLMELRAEELLDKCYLLKKMEEKGSCLGE